jgi:hypothetical protein
VTYLEFETAEDFLNYLGASGDQGKANLETLKSWSNYGANLKARSIVRNELLAKMEGPDKSINKSINDFVKARAAAGKPITEAQARKMVLAMMAMEAETEETANPPAETPATA